MPSSKKSFGLSKETVFSLFLCSYMILPLLNSGEWIVYATQGRSFLAVVCLCVVLRVSFWLLPSWYEKSLDWTFSYAVRLSFKGFGWGFPLLQKYPRLVGTFYAVCLLSSLVKLEFPEAEWVSVLANVLYTVRNLLIIPFLGVNFLITWILNETSKMESKNLIPRNTYMEIKKPSLSFQHYDDYYFRHNPLVFGSKHNWSLESRRGIFQVVAETGLSVALRETVVYTVQGTLGGLLLLTGHNAGAQKNRCMKDTHQETVNVCKQVISTSTSQEEKNLAEIIIKNSAYHYDVYQNQSASTTIIRGYKTLLDSKDVVVPATSLSQESRKAIALRAASRITGPDRQHYWEQARGITPPANSPLESCVALFESFDF